MASAHSRSRLRSPVTCHVIRGEPWKARRIQNYNLRKHCRHLGKTFQRPNNRFAAALREPCLRMFERLECASNVLSSSIMGRRRVVPALLRVAAYHERWIRDPESWQPDCESAPEAQFFDLIRHVFVRYSLPSFFDSVWILNGPLRLADRDWYCHVAQGGNIRTAPGMFVHLSKRAAHLMMEAPGHFSVRQAMRSGQLRALGVAAPLRDELLRSRAATDFRNDGVWMPLFMMLAREPGIERSDLPLLLHYLREELVANPGFKLKGRTLPDLLRSAGRNLRSLLDVGRRCGLDYREADLDRPEVRAELFSLAERVWDPMPGVEPFDYRRKEHWRIVELCSQEELSEEGEVLGHCVSTYAPSCRAGRSAIFSLRLWEKDGEFWDPFVTIQVHPPTRKIVQMRSIWNYPANAGEKQVIDVWADANGLRFDARC